MKNRKHNILTLVLILFAFVNINAERYALIISVGDYPENSGWPDISSQNDIVHVKGALLNIGFSANNINVISDSKATHDGIIVSFDELTKKLKPGDIVYIHFSGHGQQAYDDNGDEIDNLDEAIVPYDSPLKFTKGVYEGERLIRDDLLGKLTEKIRTKCGKNGQVILVLDSCHSGTGTRGFGNTRGTTTIMAPDDFTPNYSAAEKKMKIAGVNSPNLAPMASFFGASAKELNYETRDDQSKPVGSLSYAVSSVLASMKGSFTFEDFFERVKLKMKVSAPRQNPQWEGPENVQIMGGKVSIKDDTYRISEFLSGGKIKAELGTLTEVYEGTTVEIFSKDRNKVICKGEVLNAYLTNSIISCNIPSDVAKDELLVVKVLEKTHPNLQVGVSSLVEATSNWYSINNEIMGLPIIKEVGTNADLYISECKENSSLQLLTKEGDILFEEKYAPTAAFRQTKDLENRIKCYVQGNFLRSYENVSNYDFKIEIINEDCSTNKELGVITNEDIELKVGSCVQFKITNKGINGAYFSLLDIQPDNQINVLIPDYRGGFTAEEFYLKPGESYSISFNIGDPLGNETLKLITSKEPQDLSGIIVSQGKSTRGFKEKNPFEEMLSATFDERGTRGMKVRKPSCDEVGTSTLYFKIVK
jgi:archaellum component FlaF (FlaF/FlaG flagellin family)